MHSSGLGLWVFWLIQIIHGTWLTTSMMCDGVLFGLYTFAFIFIWFCVYETRMNPKDPIADKFFYAQNLGTLVSGLLVASLCHTGDGRCATWPINWYYIFVALDPGIVLIFHVILRYVDHATLQSRTKTFLKQYNLKLETFYDNFMEIWELLMEQFERDIDIVNDLLTILWGPLPNNK